MKLEEIFEKLVDPWDFVFAGVGYVGGFVVGVVATPGGLAAGETAALSSVGSLALKKALWRATAGFRARRRARLFARLLADGPAHVSGVQPNKALHDELEREVRLHQAGVIDHEQMQVVLDALVEKYRALENKRAEKTRALPEHGVAALPPVERDRELEPG